MRDRLIILLNDHTCLEEEGCKEECSACLADHLIANGVTIREEGRWKGAGMGDYRCSLCDEIVSGDHHNYCPSCGAYMK